MKQFLISVMALVLGVVLVNPAEAKYSKGGKNGGRSSRTKLHKHNNKNKRFTSTGNKTKRKKGKGTSVKGNRRGKGKYGKGNSVKGNRRGKGKYGKGNSVKGNRRGKGKYGKGNLAKKGKGLGKGRKLTDRERSKLRRARRKLKNERARRALMKMAKGEGMDGGELDDIQDALDDLDSGLGEDDREAISDALNAARGAMGGGGGVTGGGASGGGGAEDGGAEDGNGDADTGDADTGEEADGSGEAETEAAPRAVKQTQRYLRVANATGKDLTVHVQYRTTKDGNTFAWLPGDPKNSQDTATFVVPAGKTMYLDDQDFRVNASRARIWVDGGPKKWLQYKTKDLWLVPEDGNQDGEHYYFAPEMGTFTYTFK
jgi:hypothetical protein